MGKEALEAYSSGYAGRPVCHFEPGMTGIIDSVDVPYVRRSRGLSESFACVDFIHPRTHVRGDYRWRAGVDPTNLVPISGAPERSSESILYLIDSPSGSGLSPYTALDRAILRAATGARSVSAGDLNTLRSGLAQYGISVEVVRTTILELPL